jgi:hypothetical protein
MFLLSFFRLVASWNDILESLFLLFLFYFIKEANTNTPIFILVVRCDITGTVTGTQFFSGIPFTVSLSGMLMALLNYTNAFSFFFRFLEQLFAVSFSEWVLLVLMAILMPFISSFF